MRKKTKKGERAGRRWREINEVWQTGPEARDPTMRHNRAATMVLHMKEGREWRDRGAREQCDIISRYVSADLLQRRPLSPPPCFSLFFIFLLHRFFYPPYSSISPVPPFSPPSPTPHPSFIPCVYDFFYLFLRFPSKFLYSNSPRQEGRSQVENARGKLRQVNERERERRETLKINSFPYKAQALRIFDLLRDALLFLPSFLPFHSVSYYFMIIFFLFCLKFYPQFHIYRISLFHFAILFFLQFSISFFFSFSYNFLRKKKNLSLSFRI